MKSERAPARKPLANTTGPQNISRWRRGYELCECESSGHCWYCSDRRSQQYRDRKPAWEIARAAARKAIHAENQQRGRATSVEPRVAHEQLQMWGS